MIVSLYFQSQESFWLLNTKQQKSDGWHCVAEKKKRARTASLHPKATKSCHVNPTSRDSRKSFRQKKHWSHIFQCLSKLWFNLFKNVLKTLFQLEGLLFVELWRCGAREAYKSGDPAATFSLQSTPWLKIMVLCLSPFKKKWNHALQRLQSKINFPPTMYTHFVALLLGKDIDDWSPLPGGVGSIKHLSRARMRLFLIHSGHDGKKKKCMQKKGRHFQLSSHSQQLVRPPLWSRWRRLSEQQLRRPWQKHSNGLPRETKIKDNNESSVDNTSLIWSLCTVVRSISPTSWSSWPLHYQVWRTQSSCRSWRPPCGTGPRWTLRELSSKGDRHRDFLVFWKQVIFQLTQLSVENWLFVGTPIQFR